jgi:hypothetical protein
MIMSKYPDMEIGCGKTPPTGSGKKLSLLSKTGFRRCGV